MIKSAACTISAVSIVLGERPRSAVRPAISSRRRRAARVWFGFRKRGPFSCLFESSAGVFTFSARLIVAVVMMADIRAFAT